MLIESEFFGRTDLRISLSRAKFDVEVDFEVYFAVARLNQCQISEKRNFRSDMFAEKVFRRKIRFSLIWRGFWRATAERTSKSASTSNFALDRLILRSVRRKNLGFDQNVGFPNKIFTG